MKKILYLLAIIVGMNVLPVTSSNAQQINVNINIGSQPAWGPVGYDYVHYYYFPDINVYYDVFTQTFYYPKGRRWIASPYLPNSYGRYNLYHLYKVVINDPNPWYDNRFHKREFSRYKGVRTQVVIMDSRDVRYNTSRNNQYHWVQPAPPKKTTPAKKPAPNQTQRATSTSRNTSTPATSNTNSSTSTSRRSTNTSTSTGTNTSTSTTSTSRRTTSESTTNSSNSSSSRSGSSNSSSSSSSSRGSR